VRALTGATAELGRVGAVAAANIDAELQRAGQPAGRIALLDVALAELDRIDATLADLDLGRRDRLLGPLEGAHADLEATVARAREKLAEGRDLVAPVRTMLAGPSRYLLLAANNAEMAGGAGLTLSAGLLSFDQGEIELGEVVRAGALRLPDSVPLPGDLRQIYRPTGVGIDFRSATRSPDLSTMGPIIADMFHRLDAAPLDGVLVVDAVALAEVMELTGEVVVDGRLIDADNVLAEVLNESYKQFQTTEERDERVSYQGDIAAAVFESLTTRDVPAAELAASLLDTSQGRHLLLWSADPALQAVWDELGTSGALHQRGLLVSFQNYAANKLDWYLRPSAALDVRLTPSGDYRARLTMTMDVPSLDELRADGASPYIVGPDPDRQGTFLTVHLPQAAYDITTPDPPGFRTSGTEGSMQVRTFLVDVPAGTTVERVVEFTLPRSEPGMVLLPSARLEPLPVTVDGTITVTDDVPTPITWLAALPEPAPDRSAPLVVLLLVRAGLVLLLLAAASAAIGARRQQRDPAAAVAVWRSTAALGVGLTLVALAVAGLVALMLAAPRV
jgi:hypothetical protein